MSPVVIDAAVRAADAMRTAAIFVASRNQVEARHVGTGYAAPFAPQPLVQLVRSRRDAVNSQLSVVVCRDHGGPWQRYDERAAGLATDTALARACASLAADVRAGVHYLHVDMSAAHGRLSADAMVRATVELIAACEHERKRVRRGALEYEVSTEHADGGVSSVDELDAFLLPLRAMLARRQLPAPTTVVLRCGTVCREGRNAGAFDDDAVRRLSDYVHATYGMLVKEHNGDYLPLQELAMHARSGLDLINIGPSLGEAETTALLALAEREAAEFAPPRQSHFRRVLAEAVATAAPLHVWYPGCAPATITPDVLRACGHYVAELPHVGHARDVLLANAASFTPDDPRAVVRRQVEAVLVAVHRGLAGACLDA